MKPLFLSIVLLLGGCATCREYPVACTVGTVVAVGAVAAAASSGHSKSTGGY